MTKNEETQKGRNPIMTSVRRGFITEWLHRRRWLVAWLPGPLVGFLTETLRSDIVREAAQYAEREAWSNEVRRLITDVTETRALAWATARRLEASRSVADVMSEHDLKTVTYWRQTAERLAAEVAALKQGKATPEQRFRAAIRNLDRAGIVPTVSAIRRELGRRELGRRELGRRDISRKVGGETLNGAECRWRADELVALGYELLRDSQGSPMRWRKRVDLRGAAA
jgi:hypothetical protein